MVVFDSIKYVLIRFQNLFQTHPLCTYFYLLPSAKLFQANKSKRQQNSDQKKSVHMRLHIKGSSPIVPTIPFNNV